MRKGPTPDVGLVNVKYKHSGMKNYPHHLGGRQYASLARSLQSLSRRLRHTLAAALYWDIDMVNAHPSIFVQYCDKRGLQCDKILYYVQNRDACLKTLMDTCGRSRDDAKSIPLAILNGGVEDFREAVHVATDVEPLQWLVDMKNQVDILHDTIFKDLDNAEWVKCVKANRKPNVHASSVNYLLCAVENDCLEAAIKFLQSKYIDTSNIVKSFDGFMLLKRLLAEVSDEFLVEMRAYVLGATGYDIEWKVKPMDEGVDLSEYDTAPAAGEQEDYQRVKEEFEENVFKCLNPLCFVVKEPNGSYTKLNRDLLKVRYENLKFNAWDEQKNEYTKKPFVPLWLSDETLRTYQTMDTYPPPMECPLNVFNTYVPLRWDTYQPVKADASTLPLHTHLKLATGNDEACYVHLIKLLAWNMQKPGRRTEVLPIFIGAEGCGKSMTTTIARRLVGEQQFMNTNKPETILFGKHSVRYASMRYVVIDDFNVGELRGGHAEKLKGAVTDEFAEVEPKHGESYMTRMMFQMIVTSNNYNPVKCTDASRRYWPMEMSADKKGDTMYFEALAAALKDDDVIKAFYDELMAMDLSDFTPNRFPHTNLSSVMKAMNASPVEVFLHEEAQALKLACKYKRQQAHFMECKPMDDGAVQFLPQREMVQRFMAWYERPENKTEAKWNNQKVQRELYTVRDALALEWRPDNSNPARAGWIVRKGCPLFIVTKRPRDEPDEEEELSEDLD